MTATEEIAQDLRVLEGMVARARGQIAEGGVLELQPLEERVQALCGRVSALPPAEGQRFKPALLALLDELTTFGGQIEAGLEALSRELGQTGRRRHAVTAYGKAPG